MTNITKTRCVFCCRQTANYDYFQKLTTGCCDQYESYELPMFIASVPEARARAHKSGGGGCTLVVGKSSSGDIASPLLSRKSSTGDNTNRDLSLAFSLGRCSGYFCR